MVLLKRLECLAGEYGFFPDERPFPLFLRYSLLILDKPSGPSSHVVTKWIKEALKMDKVGHCGTLDPKVSGVLPIAIGESTKATAIIATADKEYIGTMHLHGDVSNEELEKAVKMFETVIYQRPPVRSAVSRSLRTRRVYKLEILERNGRDVKLRVVVESGTYIRKLFFDIGEFLGVGASMTSLRRVRSGVFTEDMAVSLDKFLSAARKFSESGDWSSLRELLVPLERALVNLKKVVVKDSAVNAIAYGAPVLAPGVCEVSDGIKKGDVIGVFTLKGEIVAVAKAVMDSSEIISSRRGVVAEPIRVIMERDLYPRMWKGPSQIKPEI